jgi:hypothetical protein
MWRRGATPHPHPTPFWPAHLDDGADIADRPVPLFLAEVGLNRLHLFGDVLPHFALVKCHLAPNSVNVCLDTYPSPSKHGFAIAGHPLKD